MKKYKKIYVEITNRCNLSCSFCSKVEKPLRNMTIDEFKCIIEKIKDYTDTIYLHVKGEPLVHTNLIDFLNIAFILFYHYFQKQFLPKIHSMLQ